MEEELNEAKPEGPEDMGEPPLHLHLRRTSPVGPNQGRRHEESRMSVDRRRSLPVPETAAAAAAAAASKDRTVVGAGADFDLDYGLVLRSREEEVEEEEVETEETLRHPPRRCKQV